MVITYYGKEFFKLQVGDTTIAVNPIGKDSKFSGTKFGSDICLITTNHSDYNGRALASHGEKSPIVIDGPGEYEVKGIFIKGFQSKALLDKEEFINTIYALSFDNISLCILGALGTKELPAGVREAIGDVDIIFSPAGSTGVSAKDAYAVAVSFEPKVIIPMDFDDASLKVFLKEAEASGTKSVDKYTVKRKDLEGRDADVVVLEPANA